MVNLFSTIYFLHQKYKNILGVNKSSSDFFYIKNNKNSSCKYVITTSLLRWDEVMNNKTTKEISLKNKGYTHWCVFIA